MDLAVKVIFAYVLAYLVGSINAAYFLGRSLKKVDIRRRGFHNAGTVNAIKVLGVKAGIFTFVWDALKGVVALMIAAAILSAGSWTIPVVPADAGVFVYPAGYAAVLGHIFPFYMGFRGGRGVACAAGLVAFTVITIAINGYIHPIAIIMFTLLAVSLLIVIKSVNITGVVSCIAGIIVINWLVLLELPFLSVYLSILLFYLCYVSLDEAIAEKKPAIKTSHRKKEIIYFRKILRVAAIFLPVVYILLGPGTAVFLAAVFSAIFLVLEAARSLVRSLQKSKFLKAFLKKDEQTGLSGISYFTLASLIVMLIFPGKAAVIGISMAIFGDLFAEIIGQVFGFIRIVGKKTLEGAVSCLCVCILVGLFFRNIYSFSYPAIFISAAAATLIELLPIKIGAYKIDDNFTMIVGTSAVIWFAGPII